MLEYTVFNFGNYQLKLHHLVAVAAYLMFVLLLLRVVRLMVFRSSKMDEARKFSMHKLLRYVVWAISVIAILYLLGVNISVLLAGSAALLVGVGLGLQQIFNDFLSGVILLSDGTIKVGDVIEVNDKIYKVQTINYRTTTVMGREENFVILPNSELTRNRVINWTYGGFASRFQIDLGISYGADVEKVIEILQNIPLGHERILKTPPPFVRLEDFGESSLKISLFFYSNEVFRIERIKSSIRVAIFKALTERGIEIPFPQRVVHFASPEKGGSTPKGQF